MRGWNIRVEIIQWYSSKNRICEHMGKKTNSRKICVKKGKIFGMLRLVKVYISDQVTSGRLLVLRQLSITRTFIFLNHTFSAHCGWTRWTRGQIQILFTCIYYIHLRIQFASYIHVNYRHDTRSSFHQWNFFGDFGRISSSFVYLNWNRLSFS